MATGRGSLAAIISTAEEIEKALPKEEFPTEFVLDAPLAAVAAELEKIKGRALAVIAESKAQAAVRKAEAAAAAAAEEDAKEQKAASKTIAEALKTHKKK